MLLCDFNRLADFFHPRQNCRNRFKMRIRNFGQQSRQGGFTHARRAPENHRMQCALLQRFTQGLAARQQVFLTDVLVQIGRAQAGSQGLSDGSTSKQIHGQRLKPLDPGLFLDDISPFGDIELEFCSRDRLVGLYTTEQDVSALTHAVDQTHVVDHAVTERQVQ